jgi:hypothetical protein
MFQSFDTVDEMIAAVAAGQADADARVEPWQAAVAPGDHYVTFFAYDNGALVIYGQVLPPDPESSLRANSREVRAFSQDCPEGEYGIVHVAGIAGLITPEQFEHARALGWPNDPTSWRKSE